MRQHLWEPWATLVLTFPSEWYAAITGQAEFGALQSVLTGLWEESHSEGFSTTVLNALWSTVNVLVTGGHWQSPGDQVRREQMPSSLTGEDDVVASLADDLPTDVGQVTVIMPCFLSFYKKNNICLGLVVYLCPSHDINRACHYLCYNCV